MKLLLLEVSRAVRSKDTGKEILNWKMDFVEEESDLDLCKNN